MTDRASLQPAASSSASIERELLDAIDEILVVLAAVADGDLQRRLEPRHDETHPVGAIAYSVNAMVEALGQARQRSAAYARDLQEKIDAIERQQLAIRELSTPIIEIWRGVLCVPVVGILDSVRTSEMTSALLSAIVEMQAECAIVDITGIKAMDTRSVDHFLRMARAVRLLGARCVLSGVHPDISQTIVHMGLDLHGVETHRSMSDALGQHVRTVAARGASRAQPESREERSVNTESPRSNSTPMRRREGRA